MSDPLSCAHANEIPSSPCSCPPGCYCRAEGSCTAYGGLRLGDLSAEDTFAALTAWRRGYRVHHWQSAVAYQHAYAMLRHARRLFLQQIQRTTPVDAKQPSLISTLEELELAWRVPRPGTPTKPSSDTAEFLAREGYGVAIRALAQGLTHMTPDAYTLVGELDRTCTTTEVLFLLDSAARNVRRAGEEEATDGAVEVLFDEASLPTARGAERQHWPPPPRKGAPDYGG